MVQAVSPAALYFPAAQIVHVVVAVAVEMDPAGQFVHGVPTAENLPMGQSKQSAARIDPSRLVALPAAQSVHVFGAEPYLPAIVRMGAR